MDLNDALRRFDLIEANVAKLEAVWTEMEKLIPGSAAFFGVDCPEEREYRNLRRDYDAILEALPKIDGWTITARPHDLNAIGQLHFDVMDLGDGEVGAKVAAEETIHAPRRELDEYRHRLSRKRRELVRARLEELIVEADAALTEAVKSSGVTSRDDFTDARTPQLVGFERFVDEADRILGGSPRSDGWRRLRRHLGFAKGVDLCDIVEYDWPEVKRELRELVTERDPHPIDVADVGDIVASKPRGHVSTALNWSALDADGFERVMFAIISSAEGYENPDWLMQTNAPDHGRDLSVFRVRRDSLGGVMRDRVIIQCKHWLSKSIGVDDIAKVVAQVELWEPPLITSLVFATSGRFTLAAVQWIEKRNYEGKRPSLEMWPESHLERLLAQRPHLAVDFGLR